MTQVNQTMEDLQTKLDSFNDAVSRQDVVTMRTQADKALATLDGLDSIEAPDALKEVKTDYVEGAKDLKAALDGYVNLYTDINSASDAQPFDWSTYDQRLADIKTQYDSGIDKLKAGDEKAASLN